MKTREEIAVVETERLLELTGLHEPLEFDDVDAHRVRDFQRVGCRLQPVFAKQPPQLVNVLA
ncbi:MAG: hypothetical protein ACT4O1_16575 [Gemmatimonadota bacterium]